MTQYNYIPTAGNLGARATTDRICSVSRVYAGQPQVSTLTVAGTATDGTYSVEFQDLPVDNITVEVVRAGGVPATNDDIAAAFATAINGDDQLRSFFLVTVATNVVTITARANGDAFTLANVTAPAPGTLAAATTQAAAPANLPMGVAVALSGNGDKQIVQPDGVTAFAIQGITWDGDSKTDQTVVPTLGTQGEFVPSFAAGSMVPVAKSGVIYVAPEVDVAAGDPVFVRVTAAGAEVLGALRNDADGGDAVQIQAQWEWDGAANQPTAVRLNLPGGA